MIPLFPHFKKLEFDDRDEYTKITSRFAPYSDFNFVSLWSWSIQNDTQLSILDGSLVIRFRDYVTQTPFLSVLGDTQIDQSIKKVLEYSIEHSYGPSLHLVPEVVVQSLSKPELFSFQESRDHFDYVLAVVEQAELRGTPHERKRNLVNHVKNHHGDDFHAEIIKLSDVLIQAQMIDLYQTNGDEGRELAEEENELAAVKRLLTYPELESLHAIGIFISDRLVGFSINEIIDSAYAVGHYQRGDRRIKGVYQMINHQTALDLHKQNIPLINVEQDLGLSGLRESKLSMRPVSYLKKYDLSLG